MNNDGNNLSNGSQKTHKKHRDYSKDENDKLNPDHYNKNRRKSKTENSKRRNSFSYSSLAASYDNNDDLFDAIDNKDSKTPTYDDEANDLLDGLDDTPVKKPQISRRAQLMQERGGARFFGKSSISSKNQSEKEKTSKNKTENKTQKTETKANIKTYVFKRLSSKEKQKLWKNWLGISDNDDKALLDIVKEAENSVCPSPWEYSPINGDFINVKTGEEGKHPNFKEFEQKVKSYKEKKILKQKDEIVKDKDKLAAFGLDEFDSDNDSIQNDDSDSVELPSEDETPAIAIAPIKKNEKAGKISSFTSLKSLANKKNVKNVKEKEPEKKIDKEIEKPKITITNETSIKYTKDIEELKIRLENEYNVLLEAKKTQILELQEEISRNKNKYEEEKRILEEKIKIEANEAVDRQRIAVEAAEERGRQNLLRQATEHAKKLEEIKQEMSVSQKSLIKQHQDELLSVRKQNSDGSYIQSLAKTVQQSANSLDSLQREIREQINEQEQKILTQLQIREKLVLEKEERIRKQQADHENLVNMLQSLQRESDIERKLLRETENKLSTLHSNIANESSERYESLKKEYEKIERQKSEFEGERSEWASRYKKELEDIHNLKDHLTSQKLALEEFKFQLDQEKVLFSNDQKKLKIEQNRLKEQIISFSNQKAQYEEDASMIESKMGALSEIGEQIHKFSEEINISKSELDKKEKKVGSDIALLAQKQEEFKKMQIEIEQKSKLVHEQRLDIEKEQFELLKLRKSIMDNKKGINPVLANAIHFSDNNEKNTFHSLNLLSKTNLNLEDIFGKESPEKKEEFTSTKNQIQFDFSKIEEETANIHSFIKEENIFLSKLPSFYNNKSQISHSFIEKKDDQSIISNQINTKYDDKLSNSIDNSYSMFHIHEEVPNITNSNLTFERS